MRLHDIVTIILLFEKYRFIYSTDIFENCINQWLKLDSWIKYVLNKKIIN